LPYDIIKDFKALSDEIEMDKTIS